MKLHSNGLKGIPFPPKSLGAECLKQVISEVERLVEQAVHLARCFDSLVSLFRIYYVYGKEPNNAQKSLLNSRECIRRDTLNKKVVCLKAVEGFSQTIHVMSLSASLSFAKLWLENTGVSIIAWRTPRHPNKFLEAKPRSGSSKPKLGTPTSIGLFENPQKCFCFFLGQEVSLFFSILAAATLDSKNNSFNIDPTAREGCMFFYRI